MTLFKEARSVPALLAASNYWIEQAHENECWII